MCSASSSMHLVWLMAQSGEGIRPAVESGVLAAEVSKQLPETTGAVACSPTPMSWFVDWVGARSLSNPSRNTCQDCATLAPGCYLARTADRPTLSQDDEFSQITVDAGPPC